MKLEKILFFLSIIGILILTFISQTTATKYIGTIESIYSSNNKITIQIENSSTELILFETNSINLKKGDIIKFQGKRDIYKNKEQIIANKITLS